MSIPAFSPWRASFLVGGALILAGGPMHPAGTMAQMLADPRWVPGHALVTVGFAVLTMGLILLARSRTMPAGAAGWLRFAIAGAALQTIEMVPHTLAVVDHGNLVAGHATPVLSTHLALSVVAYPVFGVALAGFILAAARERAVGSRWIAPLGVLGAIAHGAAAPLVILTGEERFRVLFPMLAVFALWTVLAALWPVRAAAATTAARPSPQPVPSAR